MPDYAEAAEKKGWKHMGAKWRHPSHPGKELFNAKQIWDEYPEVRTRPLSVTPAEPKPAPAPEPTQLERIDEPVAVAEEAPKPKRTYTRRSGFAV